MALFKDIINGELPSEARDLLVTSRLVALAKPNSNGLRPIAVGELFYRLAAIVAMRRVSEQAAELLAPHQYGLGVAAGAEKIVHSLQHELTDTDKRLGLLQMCHCIQAINEMSSALQMWAPSWPSVCSTSAVGVHACYCYTEYGVADSHEEGDCWVCVEMEVVGRAGGCDH